MHASTELIDDFLKTVVLVTSTVAAIYSARAHKKVKEVNEAVNGVDDPNAKTIRENVQELHDDAQVIKNTVTAAPPEGQVG